LAEIKYGAPGIPMSEVNNKNKDRWLDKSSHWYIKNPAIRALMQVLGAGTFGVVSGLDSALATHIQNMRETRLRLFFEELDKGDVQLSDEIIQSCDFLHAFFATTKAALNTRRKEKIQMFARILNSFAAKSCEVGIDEYEDYLNVLDELSYREIVVLTILGKYEKMETLESQLSASMRAHSFWDDFIQEAAANLSIGRDEVESILLRLTRTGCYRIFDTTYRDVLEHCGRLTPFYYKLRKLVKHFENRDNRDVRNV